MRRRAVIAERITIEPGKRSGQPCIRGLRITVWDVLGWLAAGRSEEQILDDYPELEKDDFRAISSVSADADCYELVATHEPPPKVIWLRGCDYPTAVAEQLIRSQAIRVGEFLRNADRGVLILVP
jgi:uncharacterized protein (DUF433 family)